MKEKLCGIYIVKNTKSNKVYIGQSVDIENRHRQHLHDLRHNKHHNKHFQNAWNKYGEESFIFEILEFCSEEQLNDREIYWINYYGGCGSLCSYNHRDGGANGRLSLETKLKIGKANKGNKGQVNSGSFKKGHKPWNYGIKLEKPIWNKGKKLSNEQREKLKKSHLGQIPWNKGKKMTQEYCDAMRKRHKPTEETKQKISQTLKTYFLEKKRELNKENS